MTAFVNGQVPTATDWNAAFNALLSKTGGVLTGALVAQSKIDLTRTQTGLVNATLGGLVGTQTLSGTITGHFAPINILQSYETLNVPGGIASGLLVQSTANAGVTGGRNAIYAQQYVVGTTGNTNGQYVAVQGEASLDATDTGGVIYGGNFTAAVRGSGTNVGAGGAVGAEFNVGLQAGVTAAVQTGLQIVQFGDSVSAGTAGIDSAFAIGQQPGAIGWDYAFRISGYANQIPIKPTGGVFAILTPGTIGSGFTMNGTTITGDAWRSPGIRILGGAANLANIITLSGGSAGSGGNSPAIYSQGSATDVDLRLILQGAGSLAVYGNGGTPVFQIAGSTTSNGYVSFIPGIGVSRPNQLLVNGTANNLLLGGTTAGTGGLLPAATSGFPMIPFTSAVLSGTPVNQAVGAALAVNTSSGNLNVYLPNIGWYHIQLVAGAA